VNAHKEVLLMPNRSRKGFLVALGLALWVVCDLVPARTASAIPAFARKYRTACSTCHSDFPELNDFGWAFYKNGFKFPKDDASFVKQPQQMLGAPIYKQIFPKAIYPGEIPGSVPLGFRYEGYMQYNSKQPVALGFLPRVDLFAPGTFTALTAGSFGPNISWWVDDDISDGGSNSDGGLGLAYLKVNDIGRFLHLPKDALNIRFGQFELDLPFSQSFSINPTDYDVYDETAAAGALGTTDNPFCFCAAQRGVEFGGYPHDGNFNWSVAITDGSNDSAPTNNGKNIYVNVFNQFNLERDPEVRKAVQASGPTGPHDHTSLRLGAFYDYGKNQLNTDGMLFPGFPTINEPYYKAGGYFRFRYQSKFELYGLGMFSHDANLIPTTLPTGNVLLPGPGINYTGGFVQTQWWIYPWLIPMMRFDFVNSPFDYANGYQAGFTRDRFSPGAQVLVRANLKLVFEYEHRWAVPVPGGLLPSFYHPNGFLLGVDFAY
jgi:hypothetical protein